MNNNQKPELKKTLMINLFKKRFNKLRSLVLQQIQINILHMMAEVNLMFQETLDKLIKLLLNN